MSRVSLGYLSPNKICLLRLVFNKLYTLSKFVSLILIFRIFYFVSYGTVETPSVYKESVLCLLILVYSFLTIYFEVILILKIGSFMSFLYLSSRSVPILRLFVYRSFPGHTSCIFIVKVELLFHSLFGRKFYLFYKLIHSSSVHVFFLEL